MNGWAMRPLPFTPLSANSADGFEPEAAANDYMGVVWKGNGSPYYTFDLGSAQDVDAILLFGCTGATSDFRLRVMAASNSGMSSDLYDSGHLPFLAGADFPTHGRGVAWWTKEDGALSRRYWSIQISSLLGDIQPVIARIAIGKRLDLDRNFGFGAGFGVRDLGAVDFGPHANLIRRHGAGLRTVGLTYPSLHKDEVEEKVQPLIELARGTRPIALVTDPEEHPLRQRRAYFGFMTGDLGTVWRTAAAWEWQASMIDLVPIPADLT